MGYRVSEFAALTGVTVRALQHYDRLGLLKPSRTESGHRVYRRGDERRVRHILALRAVGMSLQQIAELLDAPSAGVDMQEALEVMRGYFSDEAWTKWGARYFYDWPSAAWRALFRDIEAALTIDPASERAQELVERSIALWQADIGEDPRLGRAVREGYGKAWGARDRWRRELQRRYAEFKIDEIAKFLGKASWASWHRRGLVHTYRTDMHSIA